MLIEEIMVRDVQTLLTTNTVKEAIDLMREKKIRHVPILDESNTLVGIITDRDLKEAIPSSLTNEKDTAIYQTELAKIMTRNPITGHPMDFVEESALLFYDKQIGCLPIVSNQEVVGIITETDLLYKYIELTGANQPGSQIEVRVPNVPGILYEVSKVFYEQKTNVLSVLVYPDKENTETKILVIRVKTMNPLNIIEGLRTEGFEVLWPNVPGINL
ncbi:acetoin utilization AcuB family protein [Sporosarcina ureilytica]|uniref:Acetoin utilization protein AcuB n=1 Tax=Sporosarcina ureilytica TaxID=298596 RepID=A0A1D8JER2_9BACL|nr:acetoin utilization AcuB family protein [Sporosarcina ureilytica]AOV07204.1 acetoin utilization protein AcuB [Sporosarcina ureilytica]